MVGKCPQYATKETEYWYNVSPQGVMPLAGTIEGSVDLPLMKTFFMGLAAASDAKILGLIRAALVQNPALFNTLRQFLGLSDKTAYLALSYIGSRTPHPEQVGVSLTECHPWTLTRRPMSFFIDRLNGKKGKDVAQATAAMIADYLVRRGLVQAARGFAGADDAMLRLMYERLIAPKEIQQREAKRRGHGCEAALAAVLEEVGVTIVPAGKAANPMGRDPHVNLEKMDISQRVPQQTHAFDAIVVHDDQPVVLIQSLIHTSDPGQYGVDKSNETVAIAQKIKKWRAANKQKPVEFWGLVDGVGFSENKTETINKLLANFDFFVQLRTLFKAPLRLHVLKLIKLKAIQFEEKFGAADIDAIRDLYVPSDVKILPKGKEPPAGLKAVQAGGAVVFL